MKRGRTDTVPFDYEVVQDNSDGELVGATKRNSYYVPPYDKRGFLSAFDIDRYTVTSYPDIAASGWQSRLNQPGNVQRIHAWVYATYIAGMDIY